MIHNLTESLLYEQPSPNALDLLPLRQFLLFVAKAHRRPMTEVARVLGVHRDTLYADLRQAEATLTPRAPAPAAVREEQVEARDAAPVYRCRRHHDRDCPATCGYLQLWSARFNREHRAL